MAGEVVQKSARCLVWDGQPAWRDALLHLPRQYRDGEVPKRLASWLGVIPGALAGRSCGGAEPKRLASWLGVIAACFAGTLAARADEARRLERSTLLPPPPPSEVTDDHAEARAGPPPRNLAHTASAPPAATAMTTTATAAAAPGDRPAAAAVGDAGRGVAAGVAAGCGVDDSAKASGTEQSDPIQPESHTHAPVPLVVPEPSHVP